MNDQVPHDRQLLESATSRLPAGQAPLADRQSELRDAWLAMGRRLDEDNADFREEELLARLSAELSAPVHRRDAQGASSRDRVWPAVLASALALGLLVMLMSWWASGRRESGPDLAGWGNDLVEARAWSDALDDDLDIARERTTSTANQASSVDDWLANLADHMQSLSDDLSTSSL